MEAGAWDLRRLARYRLQAPRHATGRCQGTLRSDRQAKVNPQGLRPLRRSPYGLDFCDSPMRWMSREGSEDISTRSSDESQSDCVESDKSRFILKSTLLPRDRSQLAMDKVGDALEVTRTDDTQEVVIIHPDLKPDASGVGRLVFSPRHARYLANLLVEHAAAAEAEAIMTDAAKRDNPTLAFAPAGKISRGHKRRD